MSINVTHEFLSTFQHLQCHQTAAYTTLAIFKKWLASVVYVNVLLVVEFEAAQMIFRVESLK